MDTETSAPSRTTPPPEPSRDPAGGARPAARDANPAAPAVEDVVLDVRGLRRRYGGADGFEAVRGVDLQVRRGELFALLGTNGAGKTSLLEVAEGLARPTAGTVRVLGLDPHRHRARVRPRTGIMLQESGFPGDLTVAEVARTWHGTLSRPRPWAEALALVGLEGRRTVAVVGLSGGERRRLDLALAVMGRPELLFLDEPTTGLDPESRHACWALLRGLLDEGTTIVLTTHYLEEAERLADRLAVLHRGQVVRSGTVADVVASEPATIRFADPGPGARPDLGDLVDLPGLAAPAVVRTGALEVPTQDLQLTLHALLRRAEEHGWRLGQLEARPASLEQAFLAIAREQASGSTRAHDASGRHDTHDLTEVAA